MFKVSEVYEKQVKVVKERPDGSEFTKIDKAFPEGTKFTNFVVDGNSFRKSEIIVVGSFEKFSSLLRDNKS